MLSSGWLFEWLSRYFAPAGYYDPLFYQCADLMPPDRVEGDAKAMPPFPVQSDAQRTGTPSGMAH
ncbi:hypothetical protein GCM10007897_05180 [Sphingobium jiangsuense]|uniref:Uncharacterized protein n=1 Tax=Sphingobium jiangsuense TaxID=870476 RepID=A0A7W6BDX0_9SPHN|nr:hypothetical protein [Sphingobium jiangsuense]MBB3925115.1 hypothetical protein [Sphingobium jiangsuense]GLS99139.1 hypothetical protein GCM10007897_05180 [Sphingobium jiangsuense]